ncbi:P-loop NTPase domain-containing protein LPA1 homolog 1 isoform X2 [Lactuca sativa]|uniref:P-loop NTPase domain-containing protein LPA1 homolog 1 isoform X2 n=1 Tax=Lactuca sativa TaxID=4236 RepID=UPI0022AF837C|nr:P-loop NTPase domain-containing protein LPA1 homolog 1 isoform X2 [Lactuca sativa]
MKKDKSVLIASPNETTEANSSFSNRVFLPEDEEMEKQQTTNDFPLPIATRNGSSKYDFVKVKVWLGDNADHYYVLSRFLLSRMLTVTKIPNHVALKIALELKKLLIDNSLLDVSQSDLEANLFKLMERRGYGQEYINRYKMMTRFHHQRVPLVILVCGTACVGKSTIATQLGQRLNLPNVLQTDMVYELLRTSTDAPLTSSPIWARDFSSSEELITEFCRECRIVRKGLAGDLKKAMKDGKPIIIEGMHVDPSIYLMDEENKSPHKASKTDENDLKETENNAEISKTETIGEELDKVSDGVKSVHIVDQVADDNKPILRKEKSRVTEPVIIPIVLKMAEFDHKALLEEWISSRKFSDKYPIQEKDKVINNLKTIQDYLCSFKSHGLTVANISATTFPQTLDWLHNHLLQVYRLPPKEAVIRQHNMWKLRVEIN